MSLLTAFSSDIIISVCSCWLSIKEIGLIDSAYCTTNGEREVLMFNLSAHHVLFNEIRKVICISNACYYKWLAKRHLSVDRLIVAESSIIDDDLNIPVHQLKSFIVQRSSAVSQNNLIKLASLCFALEEVELNLPCFVVDKVVGQFLDHCVNLKRVKVDAVFTPYGPIDAAPMQSPIYGLSSANMPAVFTGFGAQHLIEKGDSLTSLHLSNHRDLSLDTSYKLNEGQPVLPRLTSLILTGCTSLNDHLLRTITRDCSGLRNVSVAGCGKITDSAIEHLARRCLQLTEVNVAANKGVTDLGLIALASGCHALRNLNCNVCQVTDVGVMRIAECCSGLRRLKMQQTSGLISDATLSALGKHCALLELLTLDICVVTAAGITQLVKSCPLIHTLDLGYRSDLNQALGDIAQHCPLLSMLTLTAESAVTDCTMDMLAQTCRQLSVLNLGGCMLLTEKTIDSLADHCAQVLRLDVAHCTISDASLVRLAIRNPGLLSLNVNFSRNVTTNALISVVSNCPGLLELSFFQVGDENAEVLAAVTQHCPLMRTVELSRRNHLKDKELNEALLVLQKRTPFCMVMVAVIIFLGI